MVVSKLFWSVMANGVVTGEAHLRPLERRVRRLVAAGVDPAEVAWRFRRSRRSVYQILELGSRPHREVRPSANPQVLRPVRPRSPSPGGRLGPATPRSGRAFAAAHGLSVA